MVGDHSEGINIMYGVRQGCVQSSFLISLYLEHIFNMALKNKEAWEVIN